MRPTLSVAMPRPMKPAMSAAQRATGLGLSPTAARLAAIAVTASARRVSNRETEITEMAKRHGGENAADRRPDHQQAETVQGEEQRRHELAGRWQPAASQEQHEQQKRQLQPNEVQECQDGAEEPQLSRCVE